MIDLEKGCLLICCDFPYPNFFTHTYDSMFDITPFELVVSQPIGMQTVCVIHTCCGIKLFHC